MVDTSTITPSLVFPLPGYTGPITAHHGDPTAIGGSDIMAPRGTPIVSMVSGQVVFTSTQQNASSSGGNAIQIHGTDGKDYYYAHMLNAPNVKRGDSVVAGQLLGNVDNSGNAAATPSHLHIGIGYGIQEGLGAFGGLGKSFNALAYLQELEKDPRANNPQLADPTAVPNPPQIQFDPSVPGFTSANADTIKMIVDSAIAKGIDPFLALGVASRESTLNKDTPDSSVGACGVMQIYPCTTRDLQANINAGLDKLKTYLDNCHGNITCALNSYSGGAGPYYVNEVTQRAKAIQLVNPTLSAGGFSIPTIGGVVGTPGIGNVTSGPPTVKDCETIKLGSFAGQDIRLLNPVCIVQAALKNMVDTLSKWWKAWQTEHIPNWTFVVLGIVLIIIGGLALANSAGMQMPAVGQAEKAAPAAAEAAPLAEVAA